MTKLLISTYAGVVLWEDGDWRFLRRRPLDDFNFCFYGITWDDAGRIYVAESGIPYGRRGRVGMYDARFKYLGEIAALDDLVTPHQILWWGGALYVANSGRNRLDVYDTADHAADTVEWLEATGDVDHVNSVWCNGHYFWVVEHRRKQQPKRLREFDLRWRLVDTVEIPGVEGLHNVCVMGSALVTLAHDTILKVTWDKDGEPVAVRVANFKVNGYLRGLARTSSRWYVGMSQVRRRGERGKGPCQFHVLDREFGLIETVQLEDTGGVTEIRVVDEPDFCHNGVMCPLEL